jgi:hypothetical protein
MSAAGPRMGRALAEGRIGGGAPLRPFAPGWLARGFGAGRSRGAASSNSRSEASIPSAIRSMSGSAS